MSLLFSFIFIAALIAVDQFLKYWAITILKPLGSMQVIDGLLSWTYVENRGAAFGIFAGKTWILIGIAACVICVLGYLLITQKLKSRVEHISICMILAGGTGNFIDRIMRGYVVDFIDINQLFSYPMFNFADCCVVGGAVAMVFYVFFEERNSANQKKGGFNANENDLSDSGKS